MQLNRRKLHFVSKIYIFTWGKIGQTLFCNILPTRNGLNVKQIEVATLVFFQMKGGTLNLRSPWFIFPDGFSPYTANTSDGC